MENMLEPGFNGADVPLIGALFQWREGSFFSMTLGVFIAEVAAVDKKSHRALLVYAEGPNQGQPLPSNSKGEGSPWYDYNYLRTSKYSNWIFLGIANRVNVAKEIPEVKTSKQEEAPTNPWHLQPIPFKKLRTGDKDGIRHFTDLEELARKHEAFGNLAAAKTRSIGARARMPMDLEIDAEEKALSLGKVIFQDDYDKLGKTDKMAWDLKNLKQSKHYAMQLKRDFLFWE